jgi:adenylyltransferase/sulfurtransferase
VKKVVILGAGGLGCPVALALRESDPALGMVIVDPDRVDRSNLSRQILYRDSDVGFFKAEVAARRVGGEAVVARFQEVPEVLEHADVVLDGTDDFATRFFANDEAVRRGIPLVHGAVLGWSGQLLKVLPGTTGCLRCLFEEPPAGGPTCAESGVFSPLCGIVGAAMARAALGSEAGVLYRWDGLRGTLRPMQVRKDPTCVVCRSVAS